MDAKERYLAVFDEEGRKKLDYVPKFIQYVRKEFIDKNRQNLRLDSSKNFQNMTYFSVPYELGFDAVFAPFPSCVKLRTIKIRKNGEVFRIGEDGQKIKKSSDYYEGGFIHSIEILNRLKNNLKIEDKSFEIRKIVNNYDRFSKKLFPVLMVDGIFDRTWQSMGISEFSRNFRIKSNLYTQTIAFYAELLNWKIKGLIEATGDQAKIINILDDMAYKGRTMISPERWKTDILPYYKSINSFISDSGMISQIHSDGDITDLIPYIKKAGFKGLQGWEGGCDPVYINENFPDFVIIGFGDVSSVLPYGDAREIINHVKILMDVLKKNRHFIIGPSTVCHENIPLKNIQMFSSAATKFGKYQNKH